MKTIYYVTVKNRKGLAEDYINHDINICDFFKDYESAIRFLKNRNAIKDTEYRFITDKEVYFIDFKTLKF